MCQSINACFAPGINLGKPTAAAMLYSVFPLLIVHPGSIKSRRPISRGIEKDCAIQ